MTFRGLYVRVLLIAAAIALWPVADRAGERLADHLFPSSVVDEPPYTSHTDLRPYCDMTVGTCMEPVR